jgi:hypothetical protein
MKKESKNIFCSVSSGYSSVLMAIKMKEWYPDHNIIYGMANTSKEDPASLKFMNECDKYFALNLIWIEGIISQSKNVGTGFGIRSFEDLKTEGEIFEDGIKKYGIPSKVNKWCNRELKLVPIKKFLDIYFGNNNYSIAVGIRADEIDRVSINYFNNNVFYPLADKLITTRHRNKFWDKQPISLGIPSFKGNCRKCFEKSNRKLLTMIKEDLENGIESFWELDMEELYSDIKLEGKESYNSFIENEGGHYFYRGNTPFKKLIEMAKTEKFRKATNEYIYENDLFDQEDECGSACVPFN